MKEGSEVPRRGNVPKREVLPDPVYNSTLVTKLVNSVMLDGKKGVAQRVVYDAFQIVETKTGKNGYDFWGCTGFKDGCRASYENQRGKPVYKEGTQAAT